MKLKLKKHTSIDNVMRCLKLLECGQIELETRCYPYTHTGKVWAAAHEIRAMRPVAAPGAQHKRKKG